MDRIFVLHEEFDNRYWEVLEDENDPLIARIKKNDVKKCGCLITANPLPCAWSSGRFFMLLDIAGDNKKDWREVSHLAGLAFGFDVEAGLEACPDWLQNKYRSLVAHE